MTNSEFNAWVADRNKVYDLRNHIAEMHAEFCRIRRNLSRHFEMELMAKLINPEEPPSHPNLNTITIREREYEHLKRIEAAFKETSERIFDKPIPR